MNEYEPRPSFDVVVQRALKNANEDIWPMVTGDVDPANLTCRDLFTYVLILCECNKHVERMPVLLERAKQMQNLNEESNTYGNFWWNWGQGSVQDPNSVEFCMRSGALIWLKHKNQLGKGRDILHEMLTPALSACRHHASMPLYTNITLMNAMNLMMLGAALDRDDLVKSGTSRFEQFCLYTYDWGIHEFCSPTYTPIQVSCLGMIERFAPYEWVQKQAAMMLELFWANVAANWLTHAHYLGGTFSRTSGVFIDGDVNMIELLWANGVLPLRDKELEPVIDPTLNVIYQGLCTWNPRQVFQNVADRPYPHNLKQRWGPLQNQTRTFFQFEDVALSTTGAQYDYPNYQDVTLAANFNVPVLMDDNSKPAIFTPGKLIFIPDAKSKGPEARYGHYTPRLWTATQNRQDALGLVLFDMQDLINLPSLEMNLMMSSWPGEIWIGNEQVSPAGDSWISLTKEPVYFRHNGVAIGVRIVWQGGGNHPTLQRVVDDTHDVWMVNIDWTLIRAGNTVQHEDAYIGVALWTRIGNGLEKDEDFANWRQKFESGQCDVDIKSSTACDITVAVAGEAGDLQIRSASQDMTHFEVMLEPEESFALFDYNGHDYGRSLLQMMPLVQNYLRVLDQLPAVSIPGSIDLSQGHIQFPMTKGYNIPNTPYVWVSPDNGDENGGSDTGCMTWRLLVSKAGHYYFWADVLPCPTDDIVQVLGKGQLPIGKEDMGTNALLFRVYQDMSKPCVQGTSLISCKDTTNWQWVPLAANKATPPTEPMLIALPEGEVYLQLFSQTSGLKIRGVCVTHHQDAKPM